MGTLRLTYGETDNFFVTSDEQNFIINKTTGNYSKQETEHIGERGTCVDSGRLIIWQTEEKILRD